MWVKSKIVYKNKFISYFKNILKCQKSFPEISDYTANMPQRWTVNKCAFANGRKIANI